MTDGPWLGEGPQPATARRLDDLAVKLRRNQPTSNARSGKRSANRQLGGMKFRRQVPIGPYVGDFLCLEAMLIIELDGGQHQVWLEQQGYRVLRFWNNDIIDKLEGVLTVIREKA